MFMGIYDGYSVVVQTNQDGLRSMYTREEFGSYRDRVIVLGDSFTFGYGFGRSIALRRSWNGYSENIRTETMLRFSTWAS